MISHKFLMLAAVSTMVTAAAVYAGKPILKDDSVAETRSGLELMAQIKSARDGAVIKLGKKDYGLVTVPPLAHLVPIRIDANDARFAGLVLKGVSGLTVEGGTIVGPGGKSYGILIAGSDNITISGMTITGAHRGIVVGKSHNIALLSNTLTGLLSDGIDIALSRSVVVRGNSCSNFSPTMDSFDASGNLTKGGGDHPDCIQAWSRPEAAPSADLTIEKNRAEGQMQGIFFGNHVRDGRDDGGFDRVIIRDNVIKVSMYHGIFLGNARDSRVTGNTISTLPGGFNPKRPSQPVKAWLRVVGGDRTVSCGNLVADFPRGQGTTPCATNYGSMK